MFLQAGLLSVRHGRAGLVLAAATFAIGLGVGATIGPVTASRNGSDAPAPAATDAARSMETSAARILHPAEVLRVVDGDTFEARVHLWPGLDITTRVRLRGIDAPELKARCGEERVKAEAAREALRTILDQGEVGISRVTLDKYGGRVLADASTRATPNVSSALLSVGAARRYSGGHRDGWCP
jgi:endonuclease YncB( thermonuclease family)